MFVFAIPTTAFSVAGSLGTHENKIRNHLEGDTFEVVENIAIEGPIQLARHAMGVKTIKARKLAV